MEQITINITGRGAEEESARIQRAIYKALAHTDGKKCRVAVSSSRVESPRDELLVPEFMGHGVALIGQCPVSGRGW